MSRNPIIDVTEQRIAQDLADVLRKGATEQDPAVVAFLTRELFPLYVQLSSSVAPEIAARYAAPEA